MPRKSESSKPELPAPAARALLLKWRERGALLLSEKVIDEARFRAWKTSAGEAVERAFGKDHQHWANFCEAGFRMNVRWNGPDPAEDERDRRHELAEKVPALTALIDVLDANQEDAKESLVPVVTSPTASRPASKNVFIVHGHDEGSLFKLEKMLRDRFGLNPIVLRDQPNKGRHLLTKFTNEAETCDFAFVLVTPDDYVHKQGDEYAQARPNVIFELGWFLGRLGQNKVVVLLNQEAQMPSDFDGIVTLRYFSEVTDKYLEIERELRAAGIV